MTLVEQLANIGSEVGRTTLAKEAGNDDRLLHALDRALELFDLTLAAQRWQARRQEICRAREVVCDYLIADNEPGSNAASLDAYFLPFNVAARRLGQDNGRI